MTTAWKKKEQRKSEKLCKLLRPLSVTSVKVLPGMILSDAPPTRCVFTKMWFLSTEHMSIM